MSAAHSAPPPIVWSIAGTDSGGGAGLAADLRAADAFGVHLCPVVAVVTAQHSRAVTRIEPVAPDLLEAQLAALAEDMPPRVIKTGLLGSAAQVRCVARWVDRLREAGPLALVVDPVLRASSGASFADAALLAAYRDALLPRATLVTPNRAEAARLLGLDGADAADVGAVANDSDLPALARALQALGTQSVAITGGDSPDAEGQVLDWIATPQAAGWLAAPRIGTPRTHGTGCTFASSAAAALALGFVPADALVLAKMATLHALRRAQPAGRGAGPVRAAEGFGADPALLPQLSWGEAPCFAAPRPGTGRTPLGLYAIVDSAERVRQVLAAGVRTVQLRIKCDHSDAPALAAEIRAAIAACEAAGAQLFVNDHWRLAQGLGAGGVHLGQEDLLALGEAGRAALREAGLPLGISSHSLWELARARALAPRYIACGPVWPTLTKAMPWCPQGLHNLAWWCAVAGAPVVAIGGLLAPEQFVQAAQCGADGACAVRVLGDDPALTVPPLQQALARGRAAPRWPVPALPRPSLPGPDA
ncbi:bifunctional hydroxymethylpyrimidine kinase/phosphomethylpyrimidine kinase [Aquabacterium sp.]|uniref:bifunctional hydroxymethylpyrimidine kinase/phosphomethylpyrimidine kinase n=1 Tax=Aquabacterium sp. TaxID=1872578 RepID=UPI003782EB56